MTPAPALATAPPRNVAVDAYRGFVMFLMMAEVLHLAAVAQAFPDSAFWRVPGLPPDARRVGRLLAARPDPAVVLVPGRRGAAVLDGARALARGQSFGAHVVPRALAGAAARRARRLPALGRARRRRTSPSKTRSRRSASATRSCSCSGSARRAVQWIALVADPRRLLARLRALSRCPGRTSTTRPSACRRTGRITLTGFAAHWNKNTNSAWAFDQWFLNLFPRAKPFVVNGGGYSRSASSRRSAR